MSAPATNDIWRERVWMVRDFEGETIGGPLSLEQVRDGMAKGTLPGAAVMARDGSTEWRPIEEVLEDAAELLPTVLGPDAPRIKPSSRPPPMPSGPPVPIRFFVALPSGRTVGPVTVEEIRTANAAGQIPPGASVCEEGQSEWRALGAVSGLLTGAPPRRPLSSTMVDVIGPGATPARPAAPPPPPPPQPAAGLKSAPVATNMADPHQAHRASGAESEPLPALFLPPGQSTGDVSTSTGRAVAQGSSVAGIPMKWFIVASAGTLLTIALIVVLALTMDGC